MQVVADLLHRGLLDTRVLVDEGLEIRPVGRNGTAVAVTVPTPGGPSVLVKGAARNAQATARLASEAHALHRLRADSTLKDYLPGVHVWDSTTAVLILERWSGAETLRQYVGRTRDPDASHAAGLGRALARLHAFAVAEADRWLAAPPPWVLDLHQPTLDWYRMSSVGNLALLELLHSVPELGRELSRLQAEWQPSCLVHGDLKWDNIIVRPRQRGDDGGLWLVDWESVAIGDPAWDVGAVLGEYLLCWLRSLAPGAGEAAAAERAGVVLDSVQVALRAFWQSYHVDHESHAAFSERAMRFAAAWLLHSLYERLQESTALTPSDVRQVQVSLNIFQQPASALLTLCGISRETIQDQPDGC